MPNWKVGPDNLEFTKDENVFKCVMHYRVTFDDNFEVIVLYAIKYALGRQTYMTSSIVNYIIPLLPKFSYAALKIMEEDLLTFSYRGNDIDKPEWMRLLSAIMKEIERRHNEV